MERVMVFIDGSNLYHGLVDYCSQTALNFEKFCNLLCGDERRLVHTYYYNIILRQNNAKEAYAGQQRFIAALQRIPHFDFVKGRTVDRKRDEKCPQCQHEYEISYQIEKGVDIQLAVQMLVSAFDNQYDTAIIVSNDGDFSEAVKEVRRLKKTVENAEFPERLPSYLSRQCSKVISLTKDFIEPCYYQPYT